MQKKNNHFNSTLYYLSYGNFELFCKRYHLDESDIRSNECFYRFCRLLDSFNLLGIDISNDKLLEVLCEKSQ